jgi:deoxyribonuclease V
MIARLWGGSKACVTYSGRDWTQMRHDWDIAADEAEGIQLRLAPHVVTHDDHPQARMVGGVAMRPIGGSSIVVAVCILNLSSMRQADSAISIGKAPLPYVPGLRAFQAGPVAMRVFEQLRIRPDLVIWDGHGIAHPKRFGLASHLGVLLDVPSIGVSEELLYGRCSMDELQEQRGSIVSVLDPTDASVIGAAVRTRNGLRPVYVSVGHRVSLECAVQIVLDWTPRYRIPEPLRHARMLSKRASLGENSG